MLSGQQLFLWSIGIAAITFGYPLRTQVKGKKRRKSLSAVAHREHFGQPYLLEGNIK